MTKGAVFLGYVTRLSKYRAKSGVLQLTLGVSLVISILCAAIIMVVFYGRISFLDQDIRNRLRDNAISGIQYIMANRTALSFNDSIDVDLFGDETDSVGLVRQPWGIFEVYKSTSKQGDHRVSKTALIAAKPSEIGMAAIYSPNNNAPLYLVGKTIIKGVVYASERKFSPGYIDGTGFQRSKLIDGEIKKSETFMPMLDTVLIHEMKLILNQKESTYNLLPIDRMPLDSALSFGNGTTNYYFSNQSIEVEDSIGGNIIIHSAIKVHVTPQARLTDVIILAPDIDIEKGFHGSVQCFATRSITVGSDSFLKYPSALVLIGNEKDSTIVIAHDAIVEGAVIIPGYDQAIGSRGVFKIDKMAVFHGMAYINGGADIQGRIWGHITARSFQTKINGAVYGNNLLNAEIDGTRRSPFMPATLLWGETKELVIAKWIE